MKIENTSLADFITLANGFCGLLAIMYVFDGEFELAMMLILLGIIIDGIDGLMARMFKIQNTHGVYLDSIADTVTFCFAPSILIYGMYYDIELGSSFQSPENALVVAASMVVVLFGILRLARFIEKGYKLKNYCGLPTPASALVIVMAVVVLDNQFTVPAIAILISILMISKIQYPKLSKIEGVAGGLVIMIGISTIWLESAISTSISSIVFILAIVYVVLGPLYGVKIKR